MKFIVSYDSYACDDGVAEQVNKYFTDFFEACDYYADCSETEDNCVISVKLEEEASAEPLPF